MVIGDRNMHLFYKSSATTAKTAFKTNGIYAAAVSDDRHLRLEA